MLKYCLKFIALKPFGLVDRGRRWSGGAEYPIVSSGEIFYLEFVSSDYAQYNSTKNNIGIGYKGINDLIIEGTIYLPNEKETRLLRILGL